MFEFTLMVLRALLSGDYEALRPLVPDLSGFTEPSYDRAQTGNLAGLVIGITIAAVVGIAVAIPVINDVVASSNASGTTKTVLGLLDLFVGLLILVAIAAPLMRRT